MSTSEKEGLATHLKSHLRMAVRIFWVILCLMTLGFPAKYRERLRLFEDLMELSDEPWIEPPTYSDRGYAESNEKSMRQKQQVSAQIRLFNLKCTQLMPNVIVGGMGQAEYCRE
jgi:hypothetical protein